MTDDGNISYPFPFKNTGNEISIPQLSTKPKSIGTQWPEQETKVMYELIVLCVSLTVTLLQQWQL